MENKNLIENQANINNIIKYNDGEIELNISIESDTIWLGQVQISELFDTSTDNVSLHLKNIFKEKELDEDSTTENFSVVRQEGNRKVKRNIKHYNLDTIISIGYRVSSYKATKFRQWATSVLKEYISKGYAINVHKVTENRLSNLENDMQFIKSQIKTNELKLDIEKYNKQNNNLSIYEYKKSHDRFLIIDNKIIYHIGASLKDLGNKWFAFSKLKDDNLELINRVKTIMENNR